MKAVFVSDDTVSGSVGGSAEREAHVHVPSGRRLLVGDDLIDAARYGLEVVEVDEADLAPLATAEVPAPDVVSEPVVEPELAAVDAKPAFEEVAPEAQAPQAVAEPVSQPETVAPAEAPVAAPAEAVAAA